MIKRELKLEKGKEVEIVWGNIGEKREEIKMKVEKRKEKEGEVEKEMIEEIEEMKKSRIKIRIIEVENIDEVIIDIDIVEIIEELKKVMGWIVENVGEIVVFKEIKKNIKSKEVVKVLEGMDLIEDIEEMIIGMIEDRNKEEGKLIKGCLKKKRREMRKWVEKRKGKRKGKGRVWKDEEIERGEDGNFKMIKRKLMEWLWIEEKLRKGEKVERLIIGRLKRKKMELKMGRKISKIEKVLKREKGKLVKIINGLRGIFKIDKMDWKCGKMKKGI